MSKKFLIALLFIGSVHAMQNEQKNLLMTLIDKSDLAGVRIFTQVGGAPLIDEEACKAAKAKYENIKSAQGSQMVICNEFLVMVMLQALAPAEVKQKLGLPH